MIMCISTDRNVTFGMEEVEAKTVELGIEATITKGIEKAFIVKPQYSSV